MFYADSAGLANVYARALEFHRMHGGSAGNPLPFCAVWRRKGGPFPVLTQIPEIWNRPRRRARPRCIGIP